MDRKWRVLLSLSSASLLALSLVTGEAGAQSATTSGRGAAPVAGAYQKPDSAPPNQPGQADNTDCTSTHLAPLLYRASAAGPDALERTAAAAVPHPCTPAELAKVGGQQHPTTGKALPLTTAPRLTEPPTVTPAAALPLDVASVKVSGRLTNSGGTGLPSISVSAIDPNAVWASFGSTTTASDGTYSIALPTGTTFLIRMDDSAGTYATGYYAADLPALGHYTSGITAATHLSTDSVDIAGIDVVLPLPAHITGTIVNDSSAGLANISVFGCPTQTQIFNYCPYAATSDADGDYSLPVPPYASYTVIFSDTTETYLWGYYDADATGHVTMNATLATPLALSTADQDNVNVTLTTAVRITGVVTGGTTGTLSGIAVYACGQETCFTSTTANDGSYSVSVVGNAQYTMEFVDEYSGTYAPGWYTTDVVGNYSDGSNPTPVDVATSSVPGINIHLPLAAHVNGTVRNANSLGLQGILVWACLVEGPSGPCFASWTDADGKYSIAIPPYSNFIIELDDIEATYASGFYGQAGFVYTQSLAITLVAGAGPIDGIDVTLPMAATSTLSVTSVATWTAGTTQDISVMALDALGHVNPTYAGTIHFTSSDASAALPADYTFTAADAGRHTFPIAATLKTIGSQWIRATDAVTASITGAQTGIVVALLPAAPTGLTATRGSASAIVTWVAPASNGSPISGYQVTSTPGSRTCAWSGGPLSCQVTGLTNDTAYTFTVRAQNAIGWGPASAPSASIIPIAAITSTYHPISPARLLDTRNGNGLSGHFSAKTPRTFQITGRQDIPVGATAVTGNVTVVGSTAAWAVYLGPSPVADPTSSTINFQAGQTAGNGLTVALSQAGTVSATYMGPAGAITDLVFDVTGFYTPDSTGQTYHPMDPVRELDTRAGNGLDAKLKANIPACFAVAGRNGVPTAAQAVTGNVTVVNPSSSWAVYLGPLSTSSPTTSAVNFSGGTVAGNNLTVALNTSGQLCATFMGPAGATTDIVFDVTGFYTADSTGASFVPINPVRLLDTRAGNGLTGQLTANSPATFVVATRGEVPSSASGVTGNVTVVGESAGWAVFMGPNATARPTTSTINFMVGEVKGNGLTVALSTTGTLSPTYMGPAQATTHLVFDVTGYFVR